MAEHMITLPLSMFRSLLAYSADAAPEGELFDIQKYAYRVSSEYRTLLEAERLRNVTNKLKARRQINELLINHRNKEIWYKPYNDCFVRCVLLRRHGLNVIARVIARALDEDGELYRGREALYWVNLIGKESHLRADNFEPLESHPFKGSKDPKNARRPVYTPGDGTSRGGSLR